MVVLLQALLGLRDEGAGALQTLAAVCDLLCQFAQLHHLEKKEKRKSCTKMKSFSHTEKKNMFFINVKGVKFGNAKIIKRKINILNSNGI